MSDNGDLEARVEMLEEQLDRTWTVANSANQTVGDLRDENESLRQEVADLRDELQEVKQFTDLLSPTEDTIKSKQTRAALALRTLWNNATSGNGIHALDAEGVAAANQGEIGRAYAHEVLRTVPRLVGDNTICWVIEEDRHADDNTRVVLELTEPGASDAVPGTAEGVPIRGGATADD